MASTAPPILPTTTTTTQPTSAVGSQPPASTPAIRLFLNRITDSIGTSLSHRRPWSELLDRSAFSKPDSTSDATLRFQKNYAYFRVNYLFVIVSIVSLSLLAHPLSLLLLFVLLTSWLFLYLFRSADQPLVLFGRSFSDRETLGLLIISSIVVVFLTSVGSVLVSALVVGFALICAHGAFRAPDDLFLEEQDPAATGFFAFLGSAASKAVVASSSAVPAASQSS